jgi:phenylpyruvate tautomerase PptA (4-oxalocrotonate tautomerase family)
MTGGVSIEVKTMPMIDAYIPEGALNPRAEAQLMAELTEILIKHEGLDPSSERVRDVTWIFMHRPTVYRAGLPATAPIYRITPTVPEGQYTDEARANLVKDVTDAVARAETVPSAEIGSRVWIFPTEIFDGGWGSRGVIRRLPEIMEYFGGSEFRTLGEKRLAAKRRNEVIALLEETLNSLRSTS